MHGVLQLHTDEPVNELMRLKTKPWEREDAVKHPARGRFSGAHSYQHGSWNQSLNWHVSTLPPHIPMTPRWPQTTLWLTGVPLVVYCWTVSSLSHCSEWSYVTSSMYNTSLGAFSRGAVQENALRHTVLYRGSVFRHHIGLIRFI